MAPQIERELQRVPGGGEAAEVGEVLGGRAPLEMDDDVLDGVTRRERLHSGDHVGGIAGHHAAPAQEREQGVAAQAAGDRIAVDGVAEGVGLAVVADEQLAGPGRQLGAVEQQRGQLEGEVLAQTPPRAVPQDRELILERDAVVLDPVEEHLLLQRAPELGGLAETK